MAATEPQRPAAPRPAPSAVQRRVGKTRNPWGVWLIALVTLGVYFFVWYYKVNREQRDYDPDINVDPTLALLAVLLGWIVIFIFSWVSVYRTGDRIQQAQTTSGANERCNGWLGLLLFILGGFNMVYYQSQLNKVWDRHGNPEEGTVI
jgi:drug/metabolite transporter (DMT)-like permease